MQNCCNGFQEDWELETYQTLPISKITINLRWKEITDEFAKLVSKVTCNGCVVLDIGGGDGSFYYLVQEICGLYVAIEPSQKRISNFKHISCNYMCRGCGEYLPYKNEIFDAVFIKATLDHCFNPEAVLHESYRVLKTGGKIFILLSNEGAWYKRLLKSYNLRRKRGKSHNFYFGSDEIKLMLQEQRFKNISMKYFDFLRLPVVMENFLFSSISKKALLLMMKTTDRIMNNIFLGQGGNFICIASK